MDNTTGGAYVENFLAFLRQHEADGEVYIEEYEDNAAFMSEMAGFLSNSTYPSGNTGIAYWLESEIEYLRSKYGDGILGEAIKKCETAFPELNDPHYYYYTKNPEVQEEIANLYSRIESYLREVAAQIKAGLVEQEARARARDQAERARETEQKYREMGGETEETTHDVARLLGSIASRIGGGVSSAARSVGKLFGRLFGR